MNMMRSQRSWGPKVAILKATLMFSLERTVERTVERAADVEREEDSNADDSR